MPPLSKSPSRNNPAMRDRIILKTIRRHETTIARSSPDCLQVKRLVKVMGLVAMAASAGVRFVDVVKWNDQGGMVPLSALANIIKNCRSFGVLLRSEDIYPDFVGHGRLAPLRINGDTARWKHNIRYSQSTQGQKGP